MTEQQKQKSQPIAIAVIGLMFIILGVASSGNSQWLFIVAGALFLVQFVINKYKVKDSRQH